MSSRTPNYWTARRSRRTFLSASALAGAGAVAVATVGCGDDDSTSSNSGGGGKPTAAANASGSAAAATPKKGGELRLTVSSQIGNMHPQQAGGSQEVRYYVYDHLVLWDYNHDKPDFIAAESYETPEPTKLIYHIRKGANWQNIAPLNGRTVTSQDIDTSWTNYAADPKSTGATTIHKVLTDRRETPDPKLLTQIFKAPSVPIFGPHGIAGPIPSTFAPPELWTSGELGTKAIGSGGYTLEKFDGSSEVRMVRRPDSWNGLDRPYIDRVTYKVITDESARAAALKAGQVDALAARDKVQAEEFASYSKDITIDKEITFPRPLLLNVKRPPFNDPRARKAIYAALDIQDLINRVDLGEGLYSSVVPPHLSADALPESEVKKYFPNDKKMARDLLTAAGFNFNDTIELKFPSDPVSQILAETLQQQFLAVGIKTKLVPEDTNTVWGAQTMVNLNYTITTASQYTRGQDADQWVGNNYKLGIGSGNKNGWENPETDTLFEKTRTEFDKNARHQLLLDLQKKYFEASAPFINLYAPYSRTARWKRYHRVLDTGYAGTLGSYEWLDG